MQRVLTKTVGRYEQGVIKDYPRATWVQIARSAKAPLDSFSKPIEELANGGKKK